MEVLVAIALVLLPAAVMVYPFLRRHQLPELLEDESTPQAELSRRWEANLASLRTAELERALGTLAEEDYLWLRQRYMVEAAAILKAMELEYQQEEELLASIEAEIAEARRRALGTMNEAPSLLAHESDDARPLGDRSE